MYSVWQHPLKGRYDKRSLFGPSSLVNSELSKCAVRPRKNSGEDVPPKEAVVCSVKFKEMVV